MALPLAPLAIVAFRYGAVALVAYAVTRLVPKSFCDQAQDDILDGIKEGLEARHHAKQVNIIGRGRRTVRILPSGTGIEIDATMFSRLKVKKVD